MTRRDYELISAVIRQEVQGVDADTAEFYSLQRLTVQLSQRLHLANPRFNERIFLMACGLA